MAVIFVVNITKIPAVSIKIGYNRICQLSFNLDNPGDRRGYCNLKEEALDRINWRNRFGRGCGPVA